MRRAAVHGGSGQIAAQVDGRTHGHVRLWGSFRSGAGCSRSVEGPMAMLKQSRGGGAGGRKRNAWLSWMVDSRMAAS